jgi:hypothetical protein
MALADFLLDSVDRYRPVLSTTTDLDGVPVTTPDGAPVTYPAQVRLDFSVAADLQGATQVTGQIIVDGAADIIETDRLVHNGIPYRVLGVEAINSKAIGAHLRIRVRGETR